MSNIRSINAEIPVATYVEATDEQVTLVMNSPVGDDTRSGYLWFRLANGDLILGVFPVGDLYERMSQQIKV